VILDLIRSGVPLETAILEGWTLTKEMVRLTSKNQPGKRDQTVFEDINDMRGILHTAVDVVHKQLNLEPVAGAHSTLAPPEGKATVQGLQEKTPKRYTLAEARKLFVQGNKYLSLRRCHCHASSFSEQ
jgi:hypothetical protein